jgi:hypothetical protein
MSQVAHVLRIASTVACGIVIAAFVFWASDEGRAGSESQVARLSQSDGPSGAAIPAEQPAGAPPAADPEHGGVRGAIEDANRALLSPFDHIGQDGDDWARHGFPALLALLTYGLLARMLIPYLVSDRR